MTDFGKRILILSPHPDDEVVACCTTIKRAQDEGAIIFVLHLTHGCPAKEIMWPWKRHLYTKKLTKRRQEAEHVASELGIELLGFGDRPARHLWQNLCDVKKEIIAALSEFEIDQLWCPAYEGGNADHDGLNGMVASMKDNINILEFAEYNFANGHVNSHKFPAPNETETKVLLSDEERDFKKRCLKLYASEQHNLDYIKTIHECYRPLATYDYTQLPHKGTLWYKRFDWVPFPHPGVDRAKPINVCKVIGFFSRC